MDELKSRGYQRRNIRARHRLSQDGPFARRFAPGIFIKGEIEFLARQQFLVAGLARGIRLQRYHAISSDKLFGRDAKPGGRKTQERLARRSGSLREIAVIEIRRMRLAPRRVALIRGKRGIAGNKLHAFKRDTQLFGHQLDLRGANSLPQLRFAGVSGDAAVAANGDPGIDLVWTRPVGGIALRSLRKRGNRVDAQIECAEAHDQRAGFLEEPAARKPGTPEGGARARGQLRFEIVFAKWLAHVVISRA